MNRGYFLLRAKVPFPSQAPFAAPARFLHPGSAHTVSHFSRRYARADGDNFSDRLMPQDSWKRPGKVAQSLVNIGVAHAARVHLHQNLIGPRLRLRNVANFPGTVHSWNDRSLHNMPP